MILIHISCAQPNYDTIYYVIPTTGYYNCPTGQECHPLSYYLNNNATKLTFGQNVSYIFLDGEHLFNYTFKMWGLNKVTLKGQGQWLEGFHGSVMQSTVVIRCVRQIKTTAFDISNTTTVHIEGLTISDCETGISLSPLLSVFTHQLSIQNCSYYGLIIFSKEGVNVSIGYSSFSHNNVNVAAVALNTSGTIISYSLTNTNISYGLFRRVSGMHFFNCNFLNKYCNISLHLEGCLFFRNNFGGTYLNTYSSVVMIKTRFIENINDAFGIISWAKEVVIEDCIVNVSTRTNLQTSGNYIFMYNYKSKLTIRNSMFLNNQMDSTGGAAIYIIVANTALLQNVLISKNALYNDNHGGALSITCSSVNDQVTFTNVTVTDNKMTGVYIERCYIVFADHSSVLANNISPFNGGGMYIDDSAIITSQNNTQVYFINNTAKGFGGAFYSSASLLDGIGSHYVVKPCSVKSLEPVFEGNLAHIAGNNVYNGRYFHCNPSIWFPTNLSTVINCTNVTKYLVFNKFPKPLALYITTSPLGVCFCNDNDTVDCGNRSLDKKLYPGQAMTLSLVTVGMCGGVTPGVLVTEHENINVVLGNSNQETNMSCKQFTYRITQYEDHKKGQIIVRNSNIKKVKFADGALTINVTFLHCPLGFQLVSGICKCNDIIQSLGDIKCNVSCMPYPIKRSGNKWLYYSHQYNCTVGNKDCPFDYCNTSTVSLNLNKPDLQCTQNRSGILCGQCQPGLSVMLGSNQCSLCQNKYISLVLIFVVAGIGLVVFLLTCNLTVSVGSINGLLFYANIIKLNEAVLFSNGETIPVLSQFISWLNLDFGIQICLFNGLDGYWKTWLQFVFPLYIWLLIGCIIVGCHYSGRLSRLCGNNAVPVLATLILISYSKLLRTIVNALMRTTIKCKEEQWNVWSVDGNIKYLSSKHIPLFVVSLIFLLIGLIYTGLVFSSQWLQRYSGKCCKSSIDPVVKLKPLIDAYCGPYKDKYRFWTGFLLVIRLIVATTFAYTTGIIPQVNNYIIILIVLITAYRSRGIYRDQRINQLESFHFVNLGLITLLNVLSDHLELSITYYVNTVSVSLSLVVFLITISIHLYILIAKKCGICDKTKLQVPTIDEENKPLQSVCKDNDSIYSPAHIIQRRESLIFDFDLN